MTAMTVTSDVRAWAPALDDRKGLRDQPRLHNFPLVTSEAPTELGVEPRPTSDAHSPCLQVVTPSFTPKRGRASLARSPLNRLSGSEPGSFSRKTHAGIADEFGLPEEARGRKHTAFQKEGDKPGPGALYPPAKPASSPAGTGVLPASCGDKCFSF